MIRWFGVRMRGAFVSLLVVLSFFCLTAEASVSEQTVRELVFRDCDQATSQVALLPSGERAEFLQFLVRVLALNTEAPNVVEAFVVSPGDARVRDSASQIWRSVDARRDQQAKECALRLLEKLGADAFSLIPELVRFYGEEALGDELAVRMEQTVAGIAEQGSQAGLQMSGPAMDRVFGSLFLPRPLLAQNVLIEAGPAVLPRLLEALTTFSDDALRQILPVLREVDPTGAEIFRALLERAPGLEPAAIELAVSRLGLAKSYVRAEVVDVAAMGAGNLPLPSSLAFQRILGQLCVAAGHLALEPAIRIPLVTRWNDSPLLLGELSSDAQECLVRSLPELAAGIQARVRDAGSEQTIRALEPLIFAVTERSHRDSQNGLFAALRSSVDENERVAAVILPWLTLFPSHRDEALKVYFQTAKRLEKLPDGEAAPLAAAISSGLRTSDSAGRERMIPVLLGWLRRGLLSEDLTEILSLLVPKVERELLNAWRTVGDDGKEVILRAFSRAGFWSVRAGKMCSDALQSDRLREAAETWFASAVKVSPEARRFVRDRVGTLSDSDRLLRLTRLRVVAANDVVQLEAALQGIDCNAAQRSWNGIFDTLRAENRLDAVGRLTRRCLSEFSDDVITSAIRLIPTQTVLGDGPERDLVFASERFELIALTLIDQRALKDPGLAALVLRTAIRHPSRRLQHRALSLLRENASHVDDELLLRLREIAKNRQDESSVRRMALEILAAKGDAEIDWDSFVWKLIEQFGEGQENPFGMSVLRLLPDGIVSKPAFEALAAGEPSRIIGGARVAGQRQARGFPFVTKLWELRTHPLFEVRVAVVLSLLEIAPATPGLASAVESILVTRSFPVARHRAIRWHESSAVSELRSHPLGRLKRGRLEILSEHGLRS